MGKEVAVKKDAQLTSMDELMKMFDQFNQSDIAKKMVDQVKSDSQTYQFFGEAVKLAVSKDQQLIRFQDEKAGSPATALLGVIVTYAKNNEYRPDQESPAPVCSSKGGENGTIYGKCAECALSKFRENIKGCTLAYKALVAILGEATLDRRGNIESISRQEEFSKTAYEINISRSSWKRFKKFLQEVKNEKCKTKLGRDTLPIDLLTVFKVATDEVNGKKVNVLAPEIYSSLVDEAFAGDVEKMTFLKRAMLIANDPKYKMEPTPYTEPQGDASKITPDARSRIKEVTEEDIEDAAVIEAKPIAKIADKGTVVDTSDEEGMPF